MKIYCSASHNWSLFLVYSLKSFHLWITNISVLYLYTTVCVMKTMLKYLQYISHQMDTRSTKRNGGICQKMYSMFYGYSSRRTCSHRYYKANVTCVSYVNGCFCLCESRVWVCASDNNAVKCILYTFPIYANILVSWNTIHAMTSACSLKWQCDLKSLYSLLSGEYFGTASGEIGSDMQWNGRWRCQLLFTVCTDG